MRLPWPWRRREAELDEEIRGHLEMAARDRVARGESPEEARYAARREFGNATLVKEVTRGMWSGAWLQDLGQDVRFAVRSLRRTPAFTAAVVLMLGMGLGAAAAMYGVLDRLLLRAPAHVRDPDRLYTVYVTHPGFRGSSTTRGFLSWREFHLLTDGVGAVAAAAASTEPWREQFTLGAQGIRAQGVLASANYFDVLGVHPALGRFFLPEDSAAAASPAAVIGYGFWRRQFGADRSALGRTISHAGVTYTIVGVAAKGFSGATPQQVDVWLPAEHAGPAAFGRQWRDEGAPWQLIARVKPGRTSTQAVAEGFLRLQAAPVSPRVGPRSYTGAQAASIIPGRAPTGLTSGLRLSYVVAGAAALVALIALANAAGLLLLRALRRRRETAVRLVLGVSRGRLLRAVAVESMTLALVGGLAACGVASIGGELLRKILLRVDWAVPVVDLRAALLTLVACLIVGFGTGLVPGWLAGRPATVAALKAGMRDTGFRRGPARGILLVVQGALSVALLAGLALYFRSYQRARAFDFGPDVDHILVAPLQDQTPEWPGPVAPEVARLAASRVAALPGVQAVALANSIQLWGYVAAPIRAEGVDSMPRGRNGPYYVSASANYFAATGLRLIRGRLFVDQGPGGPREAVVSAEMARLLWPSTDALGRCLYIGRNATDCTTIVGIVRNIRRELKDPEPSLDYYVPLAHDVDGAKALVVRSERPERLVRAVQDIVAATAGVHNLQAVRTLRDVVDPQYRLLRQGLALFGIFAGLAVLVAMMGVYSVVAYSVAQRAHEFGIRIALGARAPNLVRLVLAQALRYAVAGVAVGLTLSLIGARYVASMLFQTSSRDTMALLAAALALVLCSAAACVFPARAAARADPRQALQAE
jgi:predicted permease